jgi:RecA/RadA recombinase
MFDYTNNPTCREEMPMSVAALESLLERRWHGAVVRERASAGSGWLSGIEAVDQALGSVGIPRGRLTEVFGDCSSGKTTLVYALLAACTRRGDIGAYIDPQVSLFAPAAQAAGIELERLIVVRPSNVDALRRAVDAIVRSGACAVVAVDSAGDTLQTHHCARLVAQAEKTDTALVMISQGESQVLASFASVRLRMRRLSPMWQTGDDGGSRLAGYQVALDVTKSKLCAPGKHAEFHACLPDVIASWPQSIEPAAQHSWEEDDARATITA